MGYLDALRKQQENEIKPVTFSDLSSRWSTSSIDDEPKEEDKTPTGYERMVAPTLLSSRLGAGISGIGEGILGAAEGITGALEQAIKMPEQRDEGLFDEFSEQTGYERTLGTTTPASVAPEPTSNVYETISKVAEIVGDYTQAQREGYTPKTEAGEFVGGLIESVPQIAGAVATGGATLPLMGVTAGGQQFRESRERGGTIQESLSTAVPSGIAEAGFEALSFGRLEDLIKRPAEEVGRRAIQTIGANTLEGISEALTDVAQQYVNQQVFGDEIDPSQTAQSFAAGFLLPMFMYGATYAPASMNTVVNKIQNNQPLSQSDVQNVANEIGVDIDLQRQIQESAVDAAGPTISQRMEMSQDQVTEPLLPKLTNASINKMTESEMRSTLQSIQMPSTGTKSEMRNALKQFADTSSGTVASEASQDIASTIKSVPDVGAATIGPQTQRKAIQGESAPVFTEESAAAEVESLIDGLTMENLDDTIDKIQTIRDKAQIRGIPMNLQLFSKVNEDVQMLRSIADNSMLRQYGRYLNEMNLKGITKATRREFQKLVNIKESIKGLKQKHAAEIQSIKDRQVMERQRRKESQQRTKLLELSRELQAGRLQPELQAMANELVGNIDTMAKSMTSKTRIKLESMRDNLNELKEQGVPIDPQVEQTINRLNLRRISDMDITEVEDLIEASKEIIHKNRTKNKLLSTQRQEQAEDYASGIVTGLNQNPSRMARKAAETGEFVESNAASEFIRQFVGQPAMTIKTLMYDLGRADTGSKAVQMGEMIEDRQDVELKSRRELTNILNKYMGDFKKVASTKQWNAEQDVNGRTLTSGEKVYLKLAMDDYNVMESLEERGYRRRNATSPQKITREEIQAIPLNKDEQSAYQAAREFFDKTYELLNDAYIIKNNRELHRNEGGYVPKIVAEGTLPSQVGDFLLPGGLANTGIIQKRKGTLNELYLPDIISAFDRQMQISTKYNAYVNMVDDIKKILSQEGMSDALKANYGVASNGKSFIENYLDDLILDLQGTKIGKETGVEKPLKAIRTKAAPAILAYRATTPLIQTASYPMAVTEISPKNLAKGLAMKNGFDEAAQYNERANARQEGIIDRELADSKARQITEFGLRPIKFMDKQTVGKLWNATKLQVAEETGMTGQELLEATSKRFNRVLDTQPNYTTADRSMTMRDKSELTKALTMFSSAKSSVLNELQRGYIEGKNTGDWSQLGKASTGLATSVLMMAGISNLLKKAKGDEEKFSDSLLKRATGALPLMDVMSSVLMGYDISNVGIDAIEDIGKAFSRNVDMGVDAIKGKEVTKRKAVKNAWALIDSLAMIFGVPVETLRDDLEIAVNLSGNEELKQLFKELTDPE